MTDSTRNKDGKKVTYTVSLNNKQKDEKTDWWLAFMGIELCFWTRVYKEIPMHKGMLKTGAGDSGGHVDLSWTWRWPKHYKTWFISRSSRGQSQKCVPLSKSGASRKYSKLLSSIFYVSSSVEKPVSATSEKYYSYFNLLCCEVNLLCITSAAKISNVVSYINSIPSILNSFASTKDSNTLRHRIKKKIYVCILAMKKNRFRVI